MIVVHFEIHEVSLSTTGVRNAGRVGYDLKLYPRTERWDWKVEVDMGVGRTERGGLLKDEEANVRVPSRSKFYITNLVSHFAFYRFWQRRSRRN